MADDNTLFSRVVVENLETNDALTAAHVHQAPSGANGSVIIPLCGAAADFGVTRTATRTAENTAQLLNDPVYVNAHSDLHPAGIIRGQIR